jgi:hypothetical protein
MPKKRCGKLGWPCTGGMVCAFLASERGNLARPPGHSYVQAESLALIPPPATV